MQAAALQHGMSRQCVRSSHCCRPAALQHRPAQRRVAAHATYPRDSEESSASPIASQALQELFQLEREGLDTLSLENFRLKYGIRRGVDGRAQLRRSNGTWMQLKLDMEVSGTMLLRDTTDGAIHVLQTEKLEQIDLSDDYLLLTLFADGQWENDAQVIQISDGSKQTPLQMDEQQFKDLVGVIRTLQEMEEEEERQQADGPIDVTAEPANGR